MSLAHRVTLSRAVSPKFPESCVSCLSDEAYETIGVRVEVRDSGFGWKSLLPEIVSYALYDEVFEFEAPACPRCRERDRWWRPFRWLVLTVPFAALFVEAVRRLGTLDSYWPLVAWVVVGILGWLGLFAWFPNAFAVEIDDERVSYMFREQQYADEFADRNDAAVGRGLRVW